MKIVRRLGVSPGPVGFSGPLITRFVTPALAACSENRSSTPRAFDLRTTATRDRLWSGRNLQPQLDRVQCGRAPDTLAVDRDLDRIIGADRSQAKQPAAGAPDSEFVFSVEWKDVSHQQPAARAERQSFAVLGLRQSTRRDVGRDVGADGRIANSEAADLRRRGDVGLHQRRRHAQHAGLVVEPLARVVARQ
jgi:hypothetical protein